MATVCKNKLGQVLTFNSSGLSQFGYDKNGNMPGDMDNDDHFDANEVATCTDGGGSASSATSGGGKTWVDYAIDIANDAANVWISQNEKDTAQAQNPVVSGGINPYQNQQPDDSNTIMWVIGGAIVLGVIVMAIVAFKPVAAPAAATPAAAPAAK